MPSGPHKYGRKKKKPAHKRYNAENRCYTHKLKRVRKSSGVKAADAYRRQYFSISVNRQGGP